MMISMLIFVGVLILIGLISGWNKALEIDFTLEIKMFSNLYYRLGVTYETVYSAEDGTYVEEFIIGLFFINIVFTFYKFEA